MPRGKRNNPNLPNVVQPEDGQKAGKILVDMLPMLDIGLDEDRKPLAYTDDQRELINGITAYFKLCAAKGLRPGIIGLCGCIGLSYREYRSERDGLTHHISNENLRVIKRAHSFIEQYIEQCGANGLLNPATLIFWQKNYTGLSDNQDITITPKTDITATKTLDQLERDIPIDETEKP